jgi:hypothetical protein
MNRDPVTDGITPTPSALGERMLRVMYVIDRSAKNPQFTKSKFTKAFAIAFGFDEATITREFEALAEQGHIRK